MSIEGFFDIGIEPYYENMERSIRLFYGDCLKLLPRFPHGSVDMIFADPPYFLSNGGITCHAGRMVSVNKGKWDVSRGVEENHKFNLATIMSWINGLVNCEAKMPSLT
jgi:site-specific DNA-methyltransferase (adenine-specific)